MLCLRNISFAAKVGLAMLHIGGKLALPGGRTVDLKTIDTVSEWTIITRAASQWIVSGQRAGSFKLASLNRSGRLQSTIDIQSIYTCNRRPNQRHTHAMHQDCHRYEAMRIDAGS